MAPFTMRTAVILTLICSLILTPVPVAAKPKAEKATKEREALKKRLLQQLGKRTDGYLLLALEDSADRPVGISFKVVAGRDAAVDTVTEFIGGAVQTRRTFQLLGWFNDNADGKRLAEAHADKLQGFINQRFKNPQFTLEACYSDLGGAQSINDGIANGTIIKYLPYR